jgi:hypothetical protein
MPSPHKLRTKQLAYKLSGVTLCQCLSADEQNLTDPGCHISCSVCHFVLVIELNLRRILAVHSRPSIVLTTQGVLRAHLTFRRSYDRQGSKRPMRESGTRAPHSKTLRIGRMRI